MSDERRRMRRLRHDLERVRLLCELIRKREQRKREILQTETQIKQIELNPFMYFLGRILELLEENDTQEIFAEPVDTDEVADYLDIVKKPMDFSTMKKKLENFEYNNIDLFEEDFMLMVGNCLAYNEKDTIYYRAGTKMRDIGGSIIRHSRRQAEMLGFDQETGLQLDNKVSKKEELSDVKLMKEIDEFLNDDENCDSLDNEEHLKQLLILSDKADLIHHPSAKKLRTQKIKQEIQKLRRKISIDKMAKKDKSDEPEEVESSKNPKSAKKKVDKKRKREEDEDISSKELPKKKKKVVDTEDNEEKSKKKADKDSPQKTGTGGVNRRNAILFTRKKAAASEDKPSKKEDDKAETASSSRRRRSQEENVEPERDEFEFNEADEPPAAASPKSQKKKSKNKGKSRAKQAGPDTVDVDETMFQNYRHQGGDLDTDTDTGKQGWCSSQ